MKRFLVLVLFCQTVLLVYSQRVSRADYIEKYSKVAIDEMKRSGIPASITMAQACLESDDGNSDLAKEANNHFGIKCHATWTGPKMYKDDDAKGECFRKYSSAMKSFDDHTNFLMNTKRYAALFELKSDDYKGWAKGLKAAGYATNPKYPDLLIKIIEDNNLQLLDKGVEVKKEKSTEVKEKKEKKVKPKTQSDKPLEITIGGREVLINNRKQYIVSKQGDSYEKLTKEFEKLSWELYRFNDVEKGAELLPGVRVYLQPKRNNAERGFDTHIVKDGETLRDISQFYGVKVKTIMKKNYLSGSEKLNPGDVIYLRKSKPKKD